MSIIYRDPEIFLARERGFERGVKAAGPALPYRVVATTDMFTTDVSDRFPDITKDYAFLLNGLKERLNDIGFSFSGPDAEVLKSTLPSLEAINPEDVVIRLKLSNTVSNETGYRPITALISVGRDDIPEGFPVKRIEVAQLRGSEVHIGTTQPHKDVSTTLNNPFLFGGHQHLSKDERNAIIDIARSGGINEYQ
jgi:hypothetical protein